jgi:hypothetical protein
MLRGEVSLIETAGYTRLRRIYGSPREIPRE